MGKLDNKVAIVTASTRGIGKGIVEKLSREGATVYMAVRRVDAGEEIAQNLRNEGLNVRVVRYDGYDFDSFTSMIDKVYDEARHIDILVNNQGGMGKGMTPEDDLDVVNIKVENFQKTIDFNLSSILVACQKVIPYMIKNGGGSIVNIASMNGEFADMERTSYGVSKAALDMLTQNIALQYGRSNIRCNGVAPGFIRTDAVKNLPQEFADAYLKHVPIRRLGEVEDIANAVLFFASDDSSWISGQTLQVAGGFGCGTPMYGDIVEPYINK